MPHHTTCHTCCALGQQAYPGRFSENIHKNYKQMNFEIFTKVPIAIGSIQEQ